MIHTFKNSEITVDQTLSNPKKSSYAMGILKEIKKWIADRKNYRLRSSTRRAVKKEVNKLISDYRNCSEPRLLFTITVKCKRYDNFVKKYQKQWHDKEISDGELKNILREYNDLTLKAARSRYTRNGEPLKSETLKSTRFGVIKTTHLEPGNVMTEPGQILQMHVRKNCSKVFEPKVPQIANRHLGIEIEFCSKIKQNDIVLELYRSGLYKFVQLKEDNSLRPRPGEFGYEFAILLRETSYKKELRQIITFLTKIGATATDRRCGLHVHTDMRRRNKDVVYNNLVACQEALWKVVDPLRYDTEFCRIVNCTKFPLHFDGSRVERYKTINAAAYYRHKTIEIRMHEGCVDFKIICNWVDLLLKIINFKRKIKGNVLSLFSLKKRIKIPNLLFDKVLDQSRYWQLNGSSRPPGYLVDPIAPIPVPYPPRPAAQSTRPELQWSPSSSGAGTPNSVAESSSRLSGVSAASIWTTPFIPNGQGE